MSQQSNPATLREALDAITRKCEQYWNEADLCDAEVHAALEIIHSYARTALAASGTEPAPSDLDRAHGFLRGRRMPLNMDENEAMHKDLAEQFAEVRREALRQPAQAAASPEGEGREANQQRVDAAAQRVRQAMDYRKYLPSDPFRKDVELLIEIALAPVLEIFAAQPAATPMVAQVRRKCEVCQSLGHTTLEHGEARGYAYSVIPAAQPQRESEGLEKFKGLAKEFRREAAHWKKLDTSIAKTRQDAFNECASDIEAAVKALEHERESARTEQARPLIERLDGALRNAVAVLEYHHTSRPDERTALEIRLAKGIINSDALRAALSPQTDSQVPR